MKTALSIRLSIVQLPFRRAAAERCPSPMERTRQASPSIRDRDRQGRTMPSSTGQSVRRLTVTNRVSTCHVRFLSRSSERSTTRPGWLPIFLILMCSAGSVPRIICPPRKNAPWMIGAPRAPQAPMVEFVCSPATHRGSSQITVEPQATAHRHTARTEARTHTECTQQSHAR